MREELVASLDEQAALDQIEITKGILAKAKEFNDVDAPSPAKYLMPRPKWEEITRYAIAEY